MFSLVSLKLAKDPFFANENLCNIAHQYPDELERSGKTYSLPCQAICSRSWLSIFSKRNHDIFSSYVASLVDQLRSQCFNADTLTIFFAQFEMAYRTENIKAYHQD